MYVTLQTIFNTHLKQIVAGCFLL